MTTIPNLPAVIEWLTAQIKNKMKSNFDYLREAIDKQEDHSEWLDAIEIEMNDLKSAFDTCEDERKEEERRADDAESALKDFEDAKPSFKTVDCGIGTIEYSVDNIQLESKLEEFLSYLRHKYVGSSVLY